MKKNRIISWDVIFICLFGVLGIWCILMIFPDISSQSIENMRIFLTDKVGFYYIILGLGLFVISIYLSFSKYGSIKLGNIEKPTYSNLKWGTMIFTSTMAADILFYSLCEWIFYAMEPHLNSVYDMQKWAPTYTLFHWGPIPWSFYLVIASAFGFMIHVSGRKKQKFSEACRPLIGKKVDGAWGKIIDCIAIFSLLIGTGTTFSLATPLLSAAVSKLLKINDGVILTLIILLVVGLIYGITIWFGIKGISKLANICCYLFLTLLLYFFIGGNESIYIIETGISSIGNMVENFIGMSTWMDPIRENSFPQNWTIFYWSYWMIWCVATPFFIGMISKGRTIRSTILGGYFCGLLGTFTSFIVFGNYGLSQQIKGNLPIIESVKSGESMPNVILQLFDTLPISEIGIFLLIITMLMFYATTFDTITMVISYYSYKERIQKQEPDRKLRIFWAIMFLVLPIALIFQQSSIRSLQSMSIIMAYPIGIVFILIICSFMKEAKQYIDKK